MRKFGATRAAEFPPTTLAGELFASLNTVITELNAIMRNKYADDQAALAAWLSASRTERRQRRPPEPAPPPAQGQWI